MSTSMVMESPSGYSAQIFINDFDFQNLVETDELSALTMVVQGEVTPLSTVPEIQELGPPGDGASASSDGPKTTVINFLPV